MGDGPFFGMGEGRETGGWAARPRGWHSSLACPTGARAPGLVRGVDASGALPGMNAGGNPGGNVDWDGEHCRFCRFLILCWGMLLADLGFQADLSGLPL